MSENSNENPMMSPKGDLKRMSKNSKAVVGELREFLAHLKGKSPKEMMGSVANSNLTQSIFTATFLMAILLVAFTAIPYAMKQSNEQTKAVENSDPAEAEGAVPTQSAAPDRPAMPSENKVVSPEQAIADQLEIGETKKADPASNPLNSSNSDLLDGLDDL
jgi:hypothetical protein